MGNVALLLLQREKQSIIKLQANPRPLFMRAVLRKKGHAANLTLMALKLRSRCGSLSRILK
ncbi:hypothetical protein A3J16_02515 [Candidatus Daviesbacteria bacterium RIFCSPLOWO2_02_FULL_39_13]|nr:MAG: hypothetical protein A3J16_02515 [Candidatus Daviesbacteria bacterium RIFCSPLOWO2_02_FULL_39_13]